MRKVEWIEMSPILSIGITSYNRINELVRCIKSIQTKYADDIEIIISEDKSPLSNEIKNKVEQLAFESPYIIKFTTNKRNLGYDMNLGAIIQKCQGKYIFFLSDDDCIFKNCLDSIIPFLKKAKDIDGFNSSYGVLYGSFVYRDTGKKGRLRNGSFIIPKGESSAAKYIYDSILFSGLIFKKSYIYEFDASRFKNYNYFQVYLFLQMLYRYGGFYFGFPTILCIGDGENAYGISESSGGNAILANRKSVISNLEFNKTLIKVVRMFDEDEECHVINNFERQYSLHSYSGLSIARSEGKQYFQSYWRILNQLDIKLYPITKCYYCLLFIFGQKFSDRLLKGIRKLVKKE